ncbi:lambda exonuclease family protein [Pseudomonas sp.]|uniref:lambda exonuclease family protein n=1 Tax=Pseudomonas sp. TaxID=306 RepID=UPI0025832F37|nr:lambda exonuclease family protein [Pseudomonas sp.]
MIYTNHITGVNVYDMEQGTEEWLRHRAGVITASRAHDIIKSGRSGKSSESRATYMLELIAQVCTGLVPESASFKQAEWGHENEPLAREAYEALEFVSVNQCGLIYRDESLRCAISPDGILDDRGLEIKNPFTSQVHIATLLDGKIKPEYVTQCQYSLWVTGLDRWDFVSFDWRVRGKPENRLVVIPQYRDAEMMARFDEEIPKFISEMDEALERLGFKFFDQWRAI